MDAVSRPTDPSVTSGTPDSLERREAPLLASMTLKIRIAILSVVVLLVGVATAPSVTPTTIPPPAERAAPLLAEQVQQRTTVEEFRGVQALAGRVRGQSLTIPAVAVRPPGARWDFERSADADSGPAGFGVRIDADGHVLTHGAALRGRVAVGLQSTDGAVARAELIAYEASTGLALLRMLDATSAPAVPLAAAVPPPGSLVLAAAEPNGTMMAVPGYVMRVRGATFRVSGASGDVAPGMPVYDADAALVGVMGEEPAVAFDAPAAVARLKGAAAAGTGLTSAIGIAVQPLTGPLSAAFGSGGVLVSDVLPEGPAAAAGLQAGDVVMQVGTAAVRTVEEFQAALRIVPVGGGIELRLRRDERDIVAPVTTASSFAVAGASGTADRPAAEGVEARALLTLPRLTGSDLPPGARVLAVNGRETTSLVQVRQALRRPGPVVLHLSQDGRRFFHVVTPPS